MSTQSDYNQMINQSRQDAYNTAIGYRRKPKNPLDPDYNFREELANSFRPKSYAEQFNDNMNERVAKRMAATRASSSDPDLAALDREEAETRSALSKSNDDLFREKLQEADRHKVDPKRQRWSAIASAATDAISGIAGMIGVANGAVHPATLAASQPSSKVSSDFYESERQKRQKALAEVHDADIKRHKDKLTSISERRKRIYEDRLRPYREEKERQDALLKQQQYQNAISQGQNYQQQANYNRERARREGINADYQEDMNKANIAAKNRSNTGAGRSGKSTKKSLDGFSSRWKY